MATLSQVVDYCDTLVNRKAVTDFPGSANGLQVANSGKVTKIGAAVDAGIVPFEEAAKAGIDFLIVHHGLFWSPLQPIAGRNYTKLKTLFDADLAVYSSHLPLDCHAEIGNNVLLLKALKLEPAGSFLNYEGTDVAWWARFDGARGELETRLKALFPGTFKALAFGPEKVGKVAVLTGSGKSAIKHMKAEGFDTLVTGELDQNHFNEIQEQELNVYPCGHYATETFGVRALAVACAEKFGLGWEFISTACPI